MNTIVQIAPQLPPAMDGVGDYCWLLWKHWPDAEARFNFIVLHGADETRLKEPVPIEAVSPSSKSLRDALDRSGARTAVLHYVGYAYQPKGIPLWLPPALEQWRNEGSGRRLITMFHEMYANSSPLRSPYWVRPWARRIMRRLVNASDAWFTSCSRYFDWLVNEFHAEPGRGTLLPIAPNVPVAPEANEERRWPLEFGRKLRIAIFGLPKTRLGTLQQHYGLLSALVRAGLIESISLIGKSDVSRDYMKQLRELQSAIGRIEWQTQFDLPPAQAAEALAACDIGCIANDAGTLTKSGVFAAFATNAVVCIASHVGGSTLSAPFNECVLLNNDTAESSRAIITELKGSNRMTARRRLTRHIARTELNWTRIAASWNEVIGRVLAAPELRAAPAAHDLNHTTPLAEARA
jgi:hypothetical protein